MRETRKFRASLILPHRRDCCAPASWTPSTAPIAPTRLTAAGMLDRVGRGHLYRLPGHPVSEHEGLVLVAAKVPQAVFCLPTTLQFHGLVTQLPC